VLADKVIEVFVSAQQYPVCRAIKQIPFLTPLSRPWQYFRIAWI